MATAMLHELFRLREMDDFPGPFAPRARKVSEELRGIVNELKGPHDELFPAGKRRTICTR